MLGSEWFLFTSIFALLTTPIILVFAAFTYKNLQPGIFKSFFMYSFMAMFLGAFAFIFRAYYNLFAIDSQLASFAFAHGGFYSLASIAALAAAFKLHKIKAVLRPDKFKKFKARRRNLKRGQGALEYLSTYGWSLLLIIIVGSSLWFMGFFNPEKMVESRQASFDSLQLLDYQGYSNGNLSVVVGNKLGRTLVFDGTCSVDGTPCTVFVSGSSNELSAGGKITLVLEGVIDGNYSEYSFDDVRIGFTDGLSGINHDALGFLKGNVLSTSRSACFLDDGSVDFAAGTHSNTEYSGSALRLSGSSTSGSFNSQVFDFESDADWSSFSWNESIPYGEELPGNAGDDGHVNMSNNVLLLHLDEASGTLGDSSGEGNDGTQSGGVTYGQTGKINDSISFDGSDDVVTIANDASLDIADELTLMFWIYPQNPSDYPDWITKGDYTESYSTWGDDGGTYFVVNGNNLAGSLVPANEWHHVAFIKNSSGRYFYLDGDLDASDSYSTAIESVTDPLYLSTSDFTFQGRFDEVSIFDRDLSADEVLEHYKRGALRLFGQVRSCDDSACSGESWSSEYDSVPSSITVLKNRYFQYRLNFESDEAGLSPLVFDAGICGVGG